MLKLILETRESFPEGIYCLILNGLISISLEYLSPPTTSTWHKRCQNARRALLKIGVYERKMGNGTEHSEVVM